MDEQVVYKPLKGYEGRYEVSSKGDVISLYRGNRRKLKWHKSAKWNLESTNVCVNMIAETLYKHVVMKDHFPCSK